MSDNYSLEKEIINVIRKEDPSIKKESIVKIEQLIKTVSLEQSFQGPIPHPEILKGYNKVVPDAAERILKMAEKQASHRQFIEKKVVSSGIRNETLGLIMAFVIVVGTIASGIFLIFTDKGLLGLSSVIVAIVGAASVFIIGKKSNRKHNKQKG